jgi:hypothetical protein
MDSDKLDNNIPEKSKFWRENIIREEMKNVKLDSDNLYAK